MMVGAPCASVLKSQVLLSTMGGVFHVMSSWLYLAAVVWPLAIQMALNTVLSFGMSLTSFARCPPPPEE